MLGISATLCGVDWTTEQQQRVAEAVRARREDELGLSQEQAVERAVEGVSKPVWSIMENARQASYKRRTKSAVCRALGWTADSLDRIARGEGPRTNVPAIPPAEDPVEIQQFRYEAMQEIARLSELLDDHEKRLRLLRGEVDALKRQQQQRKSPRGQESV